MSKLPRSKSLSLRNKSASRPGFTMIEVMLVLALAGLIFMGIFIALPNAQMNQRNSNRRADYTRLAQNISNYTSDNNGRLPKLADIKQKWLNDAGTDPDGNFYPTTYTGCDSTDTHCVVSATKPTSTNQVQVYFGFVCDANGVPTKSGATTRTFAVYGYMEKDDTYCYQSNG